ncbi:PD-(D/E)XK motif protein [Lentzea sp. NPDC042327]|uniref:PD-(D/E)XK motif protein n=1 Tax=Lentzea sp. NPDC042327 TaxID=3154801 RepID=UPI0033C64F75
MTLTYVDIRRVFDRLTLPAENTFATSYATEQLVGPHIRLAKTRDGMPALIISELTKLGISLPDRHYANIRLRHGRVLRLLKSQEPAAYSVLECVAHDRAVQDWFLRLLPALLERVGDLGADALNDQVAWLNELFRSFDSAANKNMTGIWAELFLLHEIADPVFATTAWHSDSTSRYDFTDSGYQVEVKASTHAERKHTFSASQLAPASQVLVASLVLDQSDRGPSVLELYQRTAVRLGDAKEAGDKLHRQVMTLVGPRIAEADDTRFDMQAAAENLRLYRAEDIPQVSPPFPSGVSNVRFTSELTTAAEAPAALGELSGLWALLLAVRSRAR